MQYRCAPSLCAVNDSSSHSRSDTATTVGHTPARPPSTRQEELRSFLFFTVVMAPALAVLLVATYGFIVWMWQLIAGPPGT